jgi:hypothetical protein
MSDTVDNVLNTVSEAAASGADEPTEVVVVNEEAPSEEVEEPEPVAEEVAGPEPVAEEEPAPSETSVPVSTQEVVQNVQEILSSTETNVSGNDLEERVKVLEEGLEKLILQFKLFACRGILPVS